MEEEIKKSDLAKGALAILLMIILSIMAITIAGLKEQLNTLQQKTDQQKQGRWGRRRGAGPGVKSGEKP